MGYDVRTTIKAYPEIARAFQLYQICREQTVVVYSETKSKDKTVQKIRPYTTGFSQLPAAGGLLDQPHRLLSFFELFREGDSIGFAQDRR